MTHWFTLSENVARGGGSVTVPRSFETFIYLFAHVSTTFTIQYNTNELTMGSDALLAFGAELFKEVNFSRGGRGILGVILWRRVRRKRLII